MTLGNTVDHFLDLKPMPLAETNVSNLKALAGHSVETAATRFIFPAALAALGCVGVGRSGSKEFQVALHD